MSELQPTADASPDVAPIHLDVMVVLMLLDEGRTERDCSERARGTFLVLTSLGSLDFASRPKLPVGNFVKQGFVHLPLAANQKGPARGPF